MVGGQAMTGGIKAHYDCIKAFSETDFTEDLKKFDAPTLILHGDNDQIVPIGVSALMTAKLREELHAEGLSRFSAWDVHNQPGPDQCRPARVPQGLRPGATSQIVYKETEIMATEPAMYRNANRPRRQARISLARLLNQRLADMIDLFNQTKHAHWNVKGPEFMQLHELFDGVAERVEEGCDLLAERVVTLGVAAEGTTRRPPPPPPSVNTTSARWTARITFAHWPVRWRSWRPRSATPSSN